MRPLPVVQIEGLRKVYVRREDVRRALRCPHAGPVYVESNPLWWLAGSLVALGILVIVVVLGIVYLAAYELPRWALEARARRRVQSLMVPR